MTTSLGEGKGGPLPYSSIPADHDARALGGKNLQRALRPTGADGEALNAAKHVHGDLTLARDQLALMDVDFRLGIVRQNEVMDHGLEQ